MPTPSRPHADDLPAPNDTAFIALAAKDRHTAQGALARHVLALSARFAAVEAPGPDPRDAEIAAWREATGCPTPAEAAAKRERWRVLSQGNLAQMRADDKALAGLRAKLAEAEDAQRRLSATSLAIYERDTEALTKRAEAAEADLLACHKRAVAAEAKVATLTAPDASDAEIARAVCGALGRSGWPVDGPRDSGDFARAIATVVRPLIRTAEERSQRAERERDEARRLCDSIAGSHRAAVDSVARMAASAPAKVAAVVEAARAWKIAFDRRRALATVGAGLTVAPVVWKDGDGQSKATMRRLSLRAYDSGGWSVWCERGDKDGGCLGGSDLQRKADGNLATAKAAAVAFAASINGATAAPPAVPREKVDELMRDRAEAIDRDALLWAIVALTDVLEVTWKDPGMATRAVAAIDAIVRSGTPTATLTAERLAEAIEKCPFWIATGELRPDGTHESMHEDDAAEEILRHLGPVAPPAVPEAGDTAATIAPSERQVVLIERRPDGSMVALTDSAPWPVGAPMPMLRWPPPSPPGYTHGAERAAPVAAPTPEVARTVAVAALRGLIAKWRRMTDRAGYTVEAGLAEDGCANDLESLIEAALSDACANSPARPCSR